MNEQYKCKYAKSTSNKCDVQDIQTNKQYIYIEFMKLCGIPSIQVKNRANEGQTKWKYLLAKHCFSSIFALTFNRI